MYTVRGVSSGSTVRLPPLGPETSLGPYRLDVLPQDSREVLRAVGFYEYTMALRDFDKLVSLVQADKLKAFDELVKERDEFAVFTNLSRNLSRGPSTLNERPERPGDNFERRRLPWITALARLELGAMLAAFTDAREPFKSVAGSGYDRKPFTELLQDGMRTHYWALASDRNLRKVLKKRPDQEILNYLRRLVMAQAFLQAAAEIAAPTYAPVQLGELKKWKKNLDEVQNALVDYLRAYLGQRGSSEAFANACGSACKRLQERSQTSAASPKN